MGTMQMKKYNLTDDELQQVANLAKQEQGSVEGAKAEASLMCNLLETHYTKYGSDLITFLKKSGWFSKASYWMEHGSAGSAYVEAVRDVVNNGNRTLPINIDEHDCFSDIISVVNNGVDVTDRKRDRSVYIKDVTQIRNRYGSKYTFYCFPTMTSDPFGYIYELKKEEKKMVTRLSIIAQARSWLGKNEQDGSHKEIINIYNAHRPLPRGYKVKYTDHWCATFVSAVAIKCGASDDLIPIECGCQEMIEKAKNLGIWVEDDSYVPMIGDIIMYDWQDSGSGDNTGYADHVGLVEAVTDNVIGVIEGNKNDSVSRRSIPVNGKYIRGFIVPKYAEIPAVGSLPANDQKKFTISGSGTPSEKTVFRAKTTTVLNVRKWAGTEHETCSFSPLPVNAEVEVCDSILSTTGRTWYFIRYKGKFGFVSSLYVTA